MMDREVYRKSKFSLGKPPVVDPCLKCLFKAICEIDCIDRFKYIRNNPPVQNSLKIKSKRIKHINFRRNINGIRD